MEMAVSLIPLTMILVGIFEGGRLMMVQEQAVNAAREGARLAVLGGATIGTPSGTGPNDVSYRVREYLAAAQVPTSGVTISVTDLDRMTITDLPQASVGDRIQVGVSVPFADVAWMTPWFFGQATVKAACVMRKEAP